MKKPASPKRRSASVPYDAADYLKTDEDIAAYLEVAIEDGEPETLLTALRNVAKVRGMTQLARSAGITREALYRMLADGGNPELRSLVRIVDALGFRVALVPKAA